jgi:hypothetical protein
MGMLYFEHLLDIVGLRWLSLAMSWTVVFDLTGGKRFFFIPQRPGGRPSFLRNWYSELFP